MSHDLHNSWRSTPEVFEKQLDLNLKQLNDKTLPEHWEAFIAMVKVSRAESILDVGCGCGAYWELCNRFLPNVAYFGIDYSTDAISIAKKTWNNDSFKCMSYTELTPEYEAIHIGALLDVLPNGDEALEFFLRLNANALIIGRMKLTNDDSYYRTYMAYDSITTCEYHHNADNFLSVCKKYGYKILSIKDNFLLMKDPHAIS